MTSNAGEDVNGNKTLGTTLVSRAIHDDSAGAKSACYRMSVKHSDVKNPIEGNLLVDLDEYSFDEARTAE